MLFSLVRASDVFLSVMKGPILYNEGIGLPTQHSHTLSALITGTVFILILWNISILVGEQVNWCCKLKFARCKLVEKISIVSTKHRWNNDCSAEPVLFHYCQYYLPMIWSTTPCSGMLCEWNVLGGTLLVPASTCASCDLICKTYSPMFLLALKPEKYLILYTNPVALVLLFSACYWLK